MLNETDFACHSLRQRAILAIINRPNRRTVPALHEEFNINKFLTVFLCAVNVSSIVRDRLLRYVSPSELDSTSQVSHGNYRQTCYLVLPNVNVKAIDVRINTNIPVLSFYVMRILARAIKKSSDYLSAGLKWF